MSRTSDSNDCGLFVGHIAGVFGQSRDSCIRLRLVYDSRGQG